jgi:PAS domain S-box-containing protein
VIPERERTDDPAPAAAPRSADGTASAAPGGKESSDGLRAELEAARRCLRLSGVMFLEIDASGRVADINERGCQILGASREEIIEADWFSRFLPERDRESVRSWFDSLMRGDAVSHGQAENRIVTAEGEERTIRWNNHVLTDADGRPTGTLSSGIDITERRRAEDAQRLAHEIWNAAYAAGTVHELFRLIQDRLGLYLNTENFFIALYDKDTDTISLSYFVDSKDQDQFDSFPAGKTLTGYVLRNNTSVLLTREEADRWVEAGIVDMIGSPSQVWLGVPLRVRGEVIGALVVQSYTNPREFGPADRDMLEFVSGQIGFAIERKRAEIALRASEARNRAILNAIPDAMFQLDRQCTFLSYDAQGDAQLPLPPEAFLGHRVHEVFPPELAKTVEEKISGALETRQLKLLEYELPVPAPAGELRDFEARIVPSGPDGVLLVVRDITDRKRAERLLWALNEAALGMERTLTPDEVLETVTRSIGALGFRSLIFIVDEAGKRAVLKHTTFPPDLMKEVSDIVGFDAQAFSASIDDTPIYRQTLRERKSLFIPDAIDLLSQLVPDKPRDLLERLAHLLGFTKNIHSPLVAEDRAFGLLCVHSEDLAERDVPAITAFANQLAAALRKATLLEELEGSLEELRATQDQLLQAQKMEAVGRLAGGVAHDFNNLLTAINGYTELLLGRDDIEESVVADIEQIRKAADQAAGLTRQLLAFSRRQPLQRQVMDLNRVVSEMDGMLRRLIGEDIELRAMLDSEEVRITADPSQLEQVIINLVVNARDAMPEGGRLTVKTKNVDLDEQACARISDARPGRFACLSIEDTGNGIPPEIVGQIFEPFFSTKGPAKGTGLGLAVVYGIVRQHGGWINVYSEPRHGTVFKIYVPASQTEVREVEAPQPATSGPRGAGQRILLVEDEDAVREFAARALRQSGYAVFEAADADQAAALFEREEGDFALVFSDVVLPDKSGIRLVEDLLAKKPELHVLLSSGYTDQKSQWPMIQERGFAFLQKPYSLADLLATLKGIVAS